MATLAPGDELLIGARAFVAIATPGHSDGHLAFYCAAERLLLCGDAVLPRITPNVGLWTSAGGDPLAAFSDSLAMLATLDVTLALPGHGAPIERFHERIGELQRHHHERLADMTAAVGKSATAYQVCCAVFPTHELSSHQTRFAMAETLAHLEYLALRGQIERREDAGGIFFLPAH
jgi:glyoxylase-like metal-dependent hydrolase (beta-lactamase superfamily II)